MKIFLLLISLFFITEGILMILFPAKLDKIYRFLYRNIKIFSLMVIIFGVLLLCSASASRWKWLMEIMGIVTVINGIIGFLMPATNVKALVNRWIKNGPDIKRIGGVIIVIIGTIILWGTL